jgi:plastocyanin
MKEKRGKAGEARKRGTSAQVVVVKIEGLVYEPSRVEVSPGTTVRWVNEDPAEHTVTSEEGGGPLRSKVFGEGGSFEFTSEKPGDFAYFCEVHPSMKGIVVVR